MPTVVVIGMGDTGVLTAAHLPRSCKVIGITTKPLLVSGQELGQRLTDSASWRKHYLLPLTAFRRLGRAELVHGRATAVDPLGQTWLLRPVSAMVSGVTPPLKTSLA